MRSAIVGWMVILASLGTGCGHETQPPTAPEHEKPAVEHDLARTAFDHMLEAYTLRSDKEASARGEELLRLYPEFVKKTEAVLAELKRRKQNGAFGKDSSANRPKDFDSWESKKKIAWLIDALDEVDVRAWTVPGSPQLMRGPACRSPDQDRRSGCPRLDRHGREGWASDP